MLIAALGSELPAGAGLRAAVVGDVYCRNLAILRRVQPYQRALRPEGDRPRASKNEEREAERPAHGQRTDTEETGPAKEGGKTELGPQKDSQAELTSKERRETRGAEDGHRKTCEETHSIAVTRVTLPEEREALEGRG